MSFTLTENKGSEIRHLESNKLSTLKKQNKNTICIYIIRHAQFSNRLHQSPVLIHPNRKPVNELWERGNSCRQAWSSDWWHWISWSHSTQATLGINSIAGLQRSHDFHSRNDGKQCKNMWWITLWYIVPDVTEHAVITEFPRIPNLLLCYGN